jgi:hypothetical protein
MASDQETVASEVRTLARILTDPDTTKESIGQRVMALKGDELPKVVIRARTVQGFAKNVIDFGEEEMRQRAHEQAEGKDSGAVVAPGQRWVDKGTGVVHEFVGELSDWKVADPLGLRLALASLKRQDGSRYVTDAEIEMAVAATYKPNHTQLNTLAKRAPEVMEAIDDFREKTRGPAHLKEAPV